MTIFGFVKIGETGYSQIDFLAENSGAQGTASVALNDAILYELENTKGIHYVTRVNDAIRVMTRESIGEAKLQINKAFLRVYNITPNYMYLSNE